MNGDDVTSPWQAAAVVAGVILAGLNAGALFAFSSFVMQGLSKLPDAGGIRAMQEINRAAPTPAFMATLLSPRRSSPWSPC